MRRLAYQKLRDKLYDHIKSRYLQQGDLLPSICALAKEWNANYGTMKKAYEQLESEGIITYNNRRGAVVSHDFKTSQKTGICYIRWQGDAFCVALNNGMRRYAQEHDLELLVVDSMQSHERSIDTIKHPPENIRGMLIMPELEQLYTEAIRSALDEGLYIVLIDRVISELTVSSVASDHFMGAYIATDHLIEQHNMPVYYLGYTDLYSTNRFWVEGWREAMNQHNYVDIEPFKFSFDQITQELQKQGLSHQENLIAASEKIFDSRKSSQYAIFAGNNYIARAIYFAAEKRGLEIGKDVFVVGTGDAPRCDNLKVPLSSVWQNTEQVGYEGARLLHQHIERKLTKPVHRLIPVKLNCRQSSLGIAGNKANQ